MGGYADVPDWSFELWSSEDYLVLEHAVESSSRHWSDKRSDVYYERYSIVLVPKIGIFNFLFSGSIVLQEVLKYYWLTVQKLLRIYSIGTKDWYRQLLFSGSIFLHKVLNMLLTDCTKATPDL